MTQQNQDAAFDQAGIDLIGCAFARACQLVLSDRELGGLDMTDTQRLLARRIVAVASGGESNATRLADDAISYLRECERVGRKLRRMSAFSEIAA